MPLSNGRRPVSPEPPPAEDDIDATEEWLVPQAGQVPESRKASKTQVKPEAAEGVPAEQSEPTKADSSVSELQDRLVKAEEEVQRQAEEIAALERREAELLERHETELAAVAKHTEELERRAKAAEKRAEEAEKRTGKAAKQPRAAAKPRPPAKPVAPPAQAPANGYPLDINAVRFEDLRGLGLTVSQSARLIATRDVRMGFESLKELEDLPDLPSEVVTTLKQRLRV